MLKLAGKVLNDTSTWEGALSRLYRLSANAELPNVLKESMAYIGRDESIPRGFGHYLMLASETHKLGRLPEGAIYSVLPDDFGYLRDGDIIRLTKAGNVRTLFRAAARSNSILVTEQCNHYCLMCSQPPKDIDDSWLLDEIMDLLELIPKTTQEIGFTGGEPTLHGARFLDILRHAKSHLPHTAVHILSNGRRFKDLTFAASYAEIEHPDMMVGIPLYSDDATLHNYIVQADGAFDETIRGILNLKRLGQQVEIRVVIHQQSVKRLKQLAEFITRNLLFVDHVALMGLEMTGFTRANIEKLWIDPYDYREDLSAAVNHLAAYRMNVSVYNHPLCLVDADVLPFYKKSISEWKNEYAKECEGCIKHSDCGGFFSSGLLYRYSTHITPFRA